MVFWPAQPVVSANRDAARGADGAFWGFLRFPSKKEAAPKNRLFFKRNRRFRPNDLAIVSIHSPEGLNVQKERFLFLTFFARCQGKTK